MRLQAELDGIETELNAADAEIRRADASLAPARDAAAALLPPDWELLSEREGRLKEQLEQVSRVRMALHQQKELSDRLAELSKAEAELEGQIKAETPSVDLVELGQKMEDGMNNYLNNVATGDPLRWQYGPISFYFGDRFFQVKVQGRRWDTQLATKICEAIGEACSEQFGSASNAVQVPSKFSPVLIYRSAGDDFTMMHQRHGDTVGESHRAPDWFRRSGAGNEYRFAKTKAKPVANHKNAHPTHDRPCPQRWSRSLSIAGDGAGITSI